MIVAAVFCLYAALFIYRTSFVIEGTRYFSLFDDAMISMTYARNLAEGHGLVWNPGGERVEGYTNLGWTLYMALVHLAPVARAKASLLVQASSAALLLAALYFVRKIAAALSGGSRLVWAGAVVAAGFYLPIVSWSLQGMEVGLLILLLSIALWRAVRTLDTGAFSPVPYAVLAAAMVVRLDMAVPFAVVLACLAGFDRPNRSHHLAYGLALFAAAVIGQTAFRLAYYGDWLPNTYYHKLTGYPALFRITRGLYVALVFIWRMNWIFFLVPVALLAMRRDRREVLLAAVFGGQLAYSVYVGGDAWESWGGANRYVCVAMPAFFILFFLGLAEIGRRARTCLAGRPPGGSGTTRRWRWAGVAVTAAAVAGFNSIYGPAALGELLLLKRPVHTDDNRRMVERALAIERATDEGAKVAVVWDGAIVYFSGRPAVSILGKNDRALAREPMRTVSGWKQLVAFYPGHLKWDYAYSIGRLKPDVVAQVWHEPEAAAPWLAREYVQRRAGDFTMHFRAGSTAVRWDRLQVPGP